MTSRNGVSLIARMRSPGRSPARAAGVRAATVATTTPIVAARSAVPLQLIASAPLADRRRVDLLEPLHDVLQAGGHGQDRGHPRERLRQYQQRTEIIEG